MKIANKLSTYLAIPATIALSLGGISKSIDLIKYDILDMSRNEAEAYTRHMISDHLGSDEETQTMVMHCPKETIILNMSPDGCATLKRKTIEGMVTSNTLVPDPKMADKIKELYTDSDNGIVCAMAAPFDFGIHKQDYDYKEEKRGAAIDRTYGDGCILRYGFDKYGNSKDWAWIKYRH